jgi:hypothetical protein
MEVEQLLEINEAARSREHGEEGGRCVGGGRTQAVVDVQE